VFGAFFWWQGLTLVKGAVGSTPPAWPSKRGKWVATDTPRDSSHQPDKCQRCMGTDTLFALSEAVHSMNKVHSLVYGPPSLPPTFPECLTQAIRIVEDEEGDQGMDVMMRAADLFDKDTRTIIAYLAFTKREMRSTWLHCRLGQVAHEATLMDLSMFPNADINADML